MTTKKLAELEAKEAKIKAQIREIKSKEAAQKRKEDTRKKIIIGGACLALLEKKKPFSDKDILEYLDKTLKRNTDRILLGMRAI